MTTVEVCATNDAGSGAAAPSEASGSTTAFDAPASQHVAALKTVGSLGTGETAPETAAKAEKRRLRKLRRQRKAMLDFQNLL